MDPVGFELVDNKDLTNTIDRVGIRTQGLTSAYVSSKTKKKRSTLSGFGPRDLIGIQTRGLIGIRTQDLTSVYMSAKTLDSVRFRTQGLTSVYVIVMTRTKKICRD